MAIFSLIQGESEFAVRVFRAQIAHRRANLP
jgi:hypothetical protein